LPTSRHLGAVSLAAPTNRMSERELVACSPQLLATVERLAQIWPLEPAHVACPVETAPKLITRH
jgi:hypothetical protein